MNSQIMKLGECVSLIIDCRGKTPQKLGSNWTAEGIRVISANNVHGGMLTDEEEIRYVDDITYNKWMKESVQRGDCFLVSEGATLGESLYWDSDEKVVLGQRLYAIRTKKDILDSKYFSLYLQSNVCRKAINAISTGSTVFGISQKDLLRLEIVVPDIYIQKEIGQLKYEIDMKIQNNNRINFELESIAKTIYDYWFLQFDFPGENGKSYKSSGGKMVWNEELKREIPEGWKVDLLGNLFTSSRGISYNSKTIEGDGIPMINLASFNVDGSYKENGIKTYSGKYTADKLVKPFDLLMCNTQQTAIDYKKDIIGKAFLVPDIFNGDIVTSHHVTTIQVKKDNMKYFLHRLFNTEYFHKYVAGFASGTNILGLIFRGVENYRLEIPEDTVLDKFAELMQDIEMKKSKIIKENQMLVSLRDFLLPLLMNGQVGFKQ